jgi:hypothetical protein
MSRTTRRGVDRLAWEKRGRCSDPDCGQKIAGCLRVRRCGCGAEVVYR